MSSPDHSSPDDHAKAFWSQRWADGQIGFHEGIPNDLLASHIQDIERADRPRLRILVPLAGKALDLRWLAERGHDVVGVEIVPLAVAAFFDEQEVSPEQLTIGGLPVSRARGVSLVCADMFDVTPEAFGRFDVIYDRAALVAVEPALRERYVAQCRALLADDAITFLICFGYDQAKVKGPPYSVDADAVRTLFAPRRVELLSTRSVPTSPRVTASGVPVFEENAYRIA